MLRGPPHTNRQMASALSTPAKKTASGRAENPAKHLSPGPSTTYMICLPAPRRIPRRLPYLLLRGTLIYALFFKSTEQTSLGVSPAVIRCASSSILRHEKRRCNATALASWLRNKGGRTIFSFSRDCRRLIVSRNPLHMWGYGRFTGSPSPLL